MGTAAPSCPSQDQRQPQLNPAREVHTWILLILLTAAEGALIINTWAMRGCRQVWLRGRGGPQGALLYPQALVGAI